MLILILIMLKSLNIENIAIIDASGSVNEVFEKISEVVDRTIKID